MGVVGGAVGGMGGVGVLLLLPTVVYLPPLSRRFPFRYEEMDWVRGRPPHALLFLKAILKAAPSGLSVTPPAAPAAASAAAAANREKLARTISAEVIAPRAGGGDGGGGGGVSRDSTLARPAPTKAAVAGVPDGVGATARHSSGDTAGNVSMPASAAAAAATDAGASGGGEEKGPRRVTFSLPSIAVGGEAGVPTPRKLAEGALLAPLRDVGTVAGALRRGVGSGLREMAAAR